MIEKKEKPHDPGQDRRLKQCGTANTFDGLKNNKGVPARQAESSPDNLASTQRQAILAYLSKNGLMTTLEARQTLGICHPSARVMELRKRDYQIETHWANDIDSTGRIHRVAKYIFRSDGGGVRR